MDTVYYVMKPDVLFNELHRLSESESNGTGDGSEGASAAGSGSDSNLASEQTTPPEPETPTEALSTEGLEDILPHVVVSELDRFIVGQAAAKRSVAIALRNRWRRMHVSDPLRSEIIPKNILMVGPTGCGKTEIARRLAKLCQAPFIKVEATKYTEVGFHGKDVDTIIKDLMDVAIKNAKERAKKVNIEVVKGMVEQRLLSLLLGSHTDQTIRDSFLSSLRNGDLENQVVSVDVPEGQPPSAGGLQIPDAFGSNGDNPQVVAISHTDIMSVLGKMGMGRGSGERTEKRKMPIHEARKHLFDAEHEKLIKNRDFVAEAIKAVEESGIVFIDEIDKICQDRFASHKGASASDEGVQRDLLPLIEGCSISTKYGQIDTSRILFIASGAFHSCKPSDLLAELQGRLPIRVELAPLTEQDLYKILTTCENSLIRQQEALLAAEGIELVITDAAIRKICSIAIEVNTHVMNIGARRLHTIIEKITEDISFNCHLHKGKTVVIDAPQVEESVAELRKKIDLRKFML